MRIVADRGKCIGAGLCVAIAPEVFVQDDEDGTVVVLGEVPHPGFRDAVLEAAQYCPSFALAILDSVEGNPE